MVEDANEIDIVELLGKDSSIAHQTFHGNTVGQTQFNTGGTDWTLAYHTYAVKWQPGPLIFYIDGIERGRVATRVPSEKMYLLLDSDVGGSTAWSESTR
jgi:beta-glucanase (GH16 family)